MNQKLVVLFSGVLILTLTIADISNAPEECGNLPTLKNLFNLFPALESHWFAHRSQLEQYIDVQSQLDVFTFWSVYQKKFRDNTTSEWAEKKSAGQKLLLFYMENFNRTLHLIAEADSFEMMADIEHALGNSDIASRCRKTALRLLSSYRACVMIRNHQKKPWTQLERFVQFQAQMFQGRHAENSLKGRRFLVCQPTFGLGNRINALMMCWAMAFASRRALLLHWNCVSCTDEPAYPVGLQDVVAGGPVDWRISHLYKVTRMFLPAESIAVASFYSVDGSKQLWGLISRGLQIAVLKAHMPRYAPMIECWAALRGGGDHEQYSYLYRGAWGNEGNPVA